MTLYYYQHLLLNYKICLIFAVYKELAWIFSLMQISHIYLYFVVGKSYGEVLPALLMVHRLFGQIVCDILV